MIRYAKSKIILGSIISFIILIFAFMWNFIFTLDDLNCEKKVYSSMENIGEDSLALGESEAESINKVATKGVYICINLDEYMMYLYKNGELIKTYPVSGGKAETPSPLGLWKVVSKAEWGEGFGGSWMGFNVPWGKYGIHGTVCPWFIGKSNSSKGCIRMKNKDVNELYKLVPFGATVRIIHENPVFRVLKSGDIGSDVLEIQKSLKKLGYFQGYSNGKFDDNLKNSVFKFQKEHKIWQSGTVNKQTIKLILDYENME